MAVFFMLPYYIKFYRHFKISQFKFREYTINLHDLKFKTVQKGILGEVSLSPFLSQWVLQPPGSVPWRQPLSQMAQLSVEQQNSPNEKP